MNNLKEKIQKLEDNYYLENSKIFHQGELVEAYSFLRKLFF